MLLSQPFCIPKNPYPSAFYRMPKPQLPTSSQCYGERTMEPAFALSQKSCQHTHWEAFWKSGEQEMKHMGIDKSGETRLFSLQGLGMWQWVVSLLCPNPGATKHISRPFLCMLFYYPDPMYLAVISSTESTILNSLRRYSYQHSSQLRCLCRAQACPGR